MARRFGTWWFGDDGIGPKKAALVKRRLASYRC
jgi:hypothetical protein